MRTGRRKTVYRPFRRMARRAVLAFAQDPQVPALPKGFRGSNPLFQLAHLSIFDRPIRVGLN